MKFDNLDPIPLEAPPLDKHLSESERAFGPPLTTGQKCCTTFSLSKRTNRSRNLCGRIFASASELVTRTAPSAC